MGVVLTNVPRLVSVKERGTWLTVPGRAGDSWRGDGGLESAGIEAAVYVYEWAQLETVLQWIRKARRIRWGDCCWEYHIRGEDTELTVQEWAQFSGELGWTITIGWKAEPYRYVWPEQDAFTVVGGQAIRNIYTAPAAPVIALAGSGAGVVGIGDFRVRISSIPALGMIIDCEDKIAVNADASEVYTGLITLDETANGRWPLILEGMNAITITGGVTQVKIKPRWRWR